MKKEQKYTFESLYTDALMAQAVAVFEAECSDINSQSEKIRSRHVGNPRLLDVIEGLLDVIADVTGSSRELLRLMADLDATTQNIVDEAWDVYDSETELKGIVGRIDDLTTVSVEASWKLVRAIEDLFPLCSS
jgi:hypothetical protein